ncbi:NAD(P)/FAD-dependent oxidoreductase [Rathayibacter sp. YIM 133350]|uniref:FAD-dependent oxidoreductase n=1 Tax=Rathayibacter sp. YIM 133350 TaxID=3131992 RepID=UPI00307D9B2D
MAEVAVVGAGPVGMLVAILLAQEGTSVEVFDERVSPSERSRAIGIHPPAIAALFAAGVGAAALDRGVRIESGEVRCDGRVLGSLRFAEAARDYPFVLSLPQHDTENLLRERLQLLAPDSLHLGTRIENPAELPGRVIVGADGLRSGMRTAAGIGWEALGEPVHYVMADFPDETGFGATAVLLFERGGVVESFPLPRHRRRWVALTDRSWPGADRNDLAGLVADRTGIRLSGDAQPVSAFTAGQHLATRMHSGRVVLAGDAAHEISPIGGQGMNLGWLDAVALVAAIRAHLSGDENALARYDRVRRRSARQAALQAAFNMAMGKPARGPRLGARNALVRTLAVPPARGIVARAFTMRWL